MPRIFDNVTPDSSLGTHLRATLQDFDCMDVATGYFNLRGWAEFDEIIREKPMGERPVARILIGMMAGSPEQESLESLQAEVDGNLQQDADAETARSRRAELVQHLRLQLMRGVPNTKDRETLASLRELIVSQRVEIKVFAKRPLHGKTYIFHRPDLNNPIIGFVGSSNLTYPGLNTNLELNVDVTDSFSGGKDLAAWFTARWEDKFSWPVTEEIIDLIDDSWAAPTPRPPYEVFLKVCYDLSRDVREGLAEYSLPSEIGADLLAYQSTAVRTLARRVVSRGGTMLGDVVGLGKTITAIAVALMLREEHGMLPIVVCPKNLVSMWQSYFDKYEVHGEVISYSTAHNDLPKLGRYKFLIVDESHTLRNRLRRDYRAVEEYVDRVGAKVLLLTATPYNRKFEDVANQLNIFIQDDEDLGIAPVNALRADPRLRDRVSGKITTLDAFRKSQDPDDWKRLMSEHLVRRTRSFVKNNFSETAEDGSKFLRFVDGSTFRFPDRKAIPIDHLFGEDDPARHMVDDVTLNTLDQLQLPRYQLASYLAPGVTHSPSERVFVDNLTRGGGNVAGFVRTTLFKRLSSGGYAFEISLRRHVARNELFIYAIDNGLALPTGTIDQKDLLDDDDITEYEVEDAEGVGDFTGKRYAALVELNPEYLTWVRPELFTESLRDLLEKDTDGVRALLDLYGPWSSDRDSKLHRLVALLNDEHPGEKVLIFTEYKDTAIYLATALRTLGIEGIEAATGDSKSPTALAMRFAPESNSMIQQGDMGEGIRVLVSTDVLSEGQNLQDAHIVVNYDLPWAIVRLIQRAGRVDRVGQKSREVLLYSFFHDALNGVLSLRTRIADRLHQNAEAFGSDEVFFGTQDEVKILTDMYHGVVDDGDDQDEVDAASLAYQYWHEAEERDPDLADRIKRLPDMVDATRLQRVTEASAGVICYVRTEGGIDGFGRLEPGGEPELLTGIEALRFFEATPGEPGLQRRDDHDAIISDLVRGPLATPTNAAGRLRGVSRQLWQRLGDSLLDFGPEPREAIDLIYQHPLTAEAERRLRQAIRNGTTDDDLAMRVMLLHRDGRLVIESRSGNDPIRIVSTMGVTKP